MKKLKLDLDKLAVDSFSIARPTHEDGTVQGFDAPTYPAPSCGCTTGASYLAAFCPAPSTRTTCFVEAPR
jgi:hypothetical protein